MRPLEVENPGAGRRTGAGCGVNQQFDFSYYSRFSAKFQASCRLFFLESLIPADGFFEPSLSLGIDRALVDWEAAW
ncbi:MAG: hypothetical protein Q7O12_14285 [Deltaproteobacteria bacterium]|nr:hypothetical protein [Deltaproteobacteria bacterium]